MKRDSSRSSPSTRHDAGSGAGHRPEMASMNVEWRPTAELGALRARAALNRLIRDFFAQRSVLEVETPQISSAANCDPNIASIEARLSDGTTRWLRTSPEFAMKRLLAAGIGDCFELGRVMRAGERGRQHNQEFTLLEWYRVGWDHHRLMDETAELVQRALASVRKRAIVRETSYRQLYQDYLGIDPLTAAEELLRAPLVVYGIDPHGLTRDDWLDLLMTHLIQPTFESNRLLLVYDYPASQCALARLRPDEPAVAERFELYLGQLELANGYHELNDAGEQRTRFLRERGVRAARGAHCPPQDERLLAALGKGLPACAGVALGVDRLLMAMLDTTDIADVIAFPASIA